MTTMTVSKPSLTSTKRSYRAWSVRTVVVQLSRKLKATYRIRSERSLSHLLVALLAVVSPWAVADLPTGLNVVAGQASVSTPTANNMRINQATDKAVLNWQTFNIGVGQAVQFVQPATTSVALNRIVGNEASSIYGSLSANGQVFLLNPAGVMFAPGAQVSVGGLVASSLAISNDDFLAGRYTFSGIGGGPVDNHGTITAARGGYVLLAAPKVSNTGAITADAGSVGLLAGSRVTLDTSGVGLVRFSVDAAAVNAAITNSGSITASGGQVAVLASAVGDALATVINQTGVIRADSAVERNGMIVLSGGQTGVVRVAGTLSATGTADGQTGGTVKVLGDKVVLDSGARIIASGQAGGGTVLVGGNYQGKGAEQNASLTLVATDASIDASAVKSGDGGNVVVWSDAATGFYGAIKATGGDQAGNGGFAEVSGKQNLAFGGSVNLAAAAGSAGTLLLDPLNIIVAAAGPAVYADVSTFAAQSGTTQTVSTATLNAVGGNITLQATNDITVSSAFVVTANKSVSFQAKNNVNINSALTTSGTGAISLTADADASGVGTVALAAGVTSQVGGITLSGASITSTAAGTIVSTGAANADAGNVNITATGLVNLGAGITATGGAAGASQAGRAGGTVSITGVGGVTAGAITANGSAGNTLGIGGNAGTISVSNSGTGGISTGALAASTGNSVGVVLAGGTAGGISVTNTAATGNLTTATLTTTGGTFGHGGAVTLSALGTVATGGAAINTSGGTTLTGNAGRNAGTVSITGAGLSLGASTITASGSAGVGTDQKGGNGAAISLTSTAGMTGTGAITASGRAGSATNGAGGNAGSITALNSTAGAISLGALTASTGAALGTGAGGTAGFISVTNNAAGANLSTLALSTAGGAGGNGGNVTLASQADVTVTGTLNTSGVVLAAGTRTGSNAGSVTITGANRSITGAITASGSAANGTNQVGGAAGAVSITGAGTLGTNTINAQTGAATGLGIGGAVGSITLTGSNATLGALSTAGNANGNGGAVSITTTGTLALAGANASNGAGGTLRGDVTLLAGGAITQSGAIVTRNLSATTASAGGAAITLTNTANDAVTVNLQVKDGTTAAPGTNNVNAAISYTDANAVAISSINSGTGGTAGDVTLLAGGALTQTGAIKAATLTATTANTTAITLTNAGNDAATVNLQARTGTVAAPGTVNANVAVQYTAANGFAISGINNGASGTAGAVTLVAGGSITQIGVVNAATLAATLTGSTSALNLGTQANNIAQINTITAPGGFTLTNGNNNVTVASNITVTNNAVLIDAGTGGYTQNVDIDISAGAGPITVIANTVAIAANTGGNALTTSGVLTLKPKTAGQAMSLAGGSLFDISTTEISAISTGATGSIVIGDTASTGALTIGGAVNLAGKALTLNAGSMTDVGTQTITAQNVTLNANGQIGTSNANGIDIAATNLSVNTSGNANAFVRTGAINMGVGTSGSSVGSGTLDLMATGAVTQTVATGNITAGTLNVKTLANAGAAITLTNSANDTAVVNLKTRNLADTSNAAGVIQYSDATGFDVAAIATTGNATLSAAGAVTQSGAIAVAGLALTGTGGAYTLNNAGNAVTTLAANTGSINYKQSGALSVGTVGVAGVTTTGTTFIETTGAASNLTLNNAVTSSATGDAVILKAGSANAAGVSTGGQLINNVGAAGIVASSGSGRYLAYSGDPLTTTEGVTGYAKRYNADATFPPAGTASTFVYRITPTLTVTANTGTQVYNAAAPTLTFGTTGLIDGDTAGTALTGALTRTGDKNVLGGDVVTIGTLAAQMGYGITYTGANYSITAKVLTATASAPNKVYNGNTAAAATLAVTGGLVGTETVTATGASSFNTKDVATANLVTVNSTTLADGTNGGLASNYSLAAGQTAAASITAKALTATASAPNKVYNGNTAAAPTLAVTGGLVGTETVTATGAATFNTKDVATANLVTVNSTTLADGTNGGLASNYSLAAGQTAAANITAKALTATASAPNKVYNGNTAAAATLAVTGGLVGTETVTATGASSFNTKDVATANLVTVNSTTLADGTNGGLASNYSLAAGQTAAASITAKALTATASAPNKVYNGNTTAASTLAIASAGFVGTETVTATGAATFNTKDVATANLVTVNSTTLADGTNGGLASNYSLAAGQTAAATISRASIASVSGITAANKIQDGTTVATLATGSAAFIGKFGADVLTVATAVGAFDTPAVGTGKLVSISGITLGGTDAGNYNLTSTTASTTANILRLGSGSGSGAASFPEGALVNARDASLVARNLQREREQRCVVASRGGGDSAADNSARRLSSDLICD